MHWRRKWQPTPVFLPWESQGLGSLVGRRLWVAQGRTRLTRLSSSSRACSNSCPLSRWSHPTISSSVIPFSNCLRSFPASGYFLMIQLFASSGQSTGVSASASVLPMNIQDWFPLGWTGLISVQFKGLSRVSSTPQFKSINSSVLSLLYSPNLTSIHDHWKNHSPD